MLVKVQRTYGGLEGRRVKIGTIFSVDAPHPTGGQTISRARYNQLAQQRLLAPHSGTLAELTADEAMVNGRPSPMPRGKPAPTPANKVQPDSAPPAQKPSPRRASRAKSQEESPKEPRPLARPAGGQTGDQHPDQAPPSSSQVVRQAGGVTLVQRGTRGRRAGSPSITPGNSAPGPMPSTPATAPGGGAITETLSTPDSAAFD